MWLRGVVEVAWVLSDLLQWSEGEERRRPALLDSNSGCASSVPFPPLRQALSF